MSSDLNQIHRTNSNQTSKNNSVDSNLTKSVPQTIQTILRVLYSIQHNPTEVLDDNITIKIQYVDSPILFLRLCKEVCDSNIGSILVYCDILNISNDLSDNSSCPNLTDNSNIILKLTNELIYKSIELDYFKHININISQLV